MSLLWPRNTAGRHIRPDAARTIGVLLALRDHVIAPVLAGVQIRRHNHVPTRLTFGDHGRSSG